MLRDTGLLIEAARMRFARYLERRFCVDIKSNYSAFTNITIFVEGVGIRSFHYRYFACAIF